MKREKFKAVQPRKDKMLNEAFWQEHDQDLSPDQESNLYYCWDNQDGHTQGWFCRHPECVEQEEDPDEVN